MAHQSTPDVVDFACQTVADLTVLPRTALSDGCRSWVSAAGATHGLWCLDDNSATLVDNLTVVATSDGVGRWIYFGFAATPMAVNISVNTEALLSAVGVVAFLDGALAWVGNPAGGVGQSQDSTWQLVTQQAGVPALSAREVIASSAGGRVWQRLIHLATDRWVQQSNWEISALTGNDQSTGAPGAPIATIAEFIRRVGVGGKITPVNQMVVTYLDASIPATDNVFFTVQLANTSLFVFKGSRVQVAAGTMTAVTARNPATRTPLQVTDALQNFAGFVDKLIVITASVNPGSVGACAWIVLNQGGVSCRCTSFVQFDPLVTAIAPTEVVPVIGDSYVVYNLTQVLSDTNVEVQGGTFGAFLVGFDKCVIADLDLAPTRNSSIALGSWNNRLYTQNLRFSNGSASSTHLGTVIASNEYWMASLATIRDSLNLYGGGAKTSPNQSGPSNTLTRLGFLMQGGRWSVLHPAAELSIQDMGFMDWTGEAIRLDQGGVVDSSNANGLWGTSAVGASYVLAIRSGMAMFTTTAATRWNIAGAAANDFAFGPAAAYASGPAFDRAAIPAGPGAAFTAARSYTFALVDTTVAGGGFGGSVMDYQGGMAFRQRA